MISFSAYQTAHKRMNAPRFSGQEDLQAIPGLEPKPTAPDAFIPSAAAPLDETVNKLVEAIQKSPAYGVDKVLEQLDSDITPPVQALLTEVGLLNPQGIEALKKKLLDIHLANITKADTAALPTTPTPVNEVDSNVPAHLKKDLQHRDESRWGGRSPRALHDEGFVDLMCGEADLTVQKLTKAIDLQKPDRTDPLHDDFFLLPDTLNTLGIALALKGDTAGASAVFHRVLQQQPNLGFVKMNLANTLAIEALQTGDGDKAQQAQRWYEASQGENKDHSRPSPRAYTQNQFVFYKMLGMQDAAQNFMKELSETIRRSGEPVLQNDRDRMIFANYPDLNQGLALFAEEKLEAKDIASLYQFESEDYTQFLANPKYLEKFSPPKPAEPEQPATANPTETTKAPKKIRFRRIRNLFRKLTFRPQLPKPESN